MLQWAKLPHFKQLAPSSVQSSNDFSFDCIILFWVSKLLSYFLIFCNECLSEHLAAEKCLFSLGKMPTNAVILINSNALSKELCDSMEQICNSTTWFHLLLILVIRKDSRYALFLLRLIQMFQTNFWAD